MPEDNKKNKLELLTLRNARDLVILCLLIVVTWKMLNSNITISIKEFTFTDLLSVFVAFFAISLSIAFYFKATETSNRFYDNSYKFTKDISEILGRIEAGFGEKLKHIDEGYAGIKDRFDQLPFDANKAKEDIEAEKDEIEKKKKEQNSLLESLARRAKLAENEKEDLFQKMEKTSSELDAAKSDLRRMQRNVRKHEATGFDSKSRRGVMSYLFDRINAEVPPDLEGNVSKNLIIRIFSEIGDDLHPDAIADLASADAIDEDGDLTPRAIASLRYRFNRNN